MKRLWIVLCALACSSAFADDRIGLKEYRLGAERGALPLDNWECHGRPPLEKERHCTKYQDMSPNRLTIANTFINLAALDFVEDRLMQVGVTIPRRSFDIVQGALEQKYGKPAKAETLTLHNAMGATFPVRQFTWTIGQDSIVANEGASNSDMSSVVYTSEEYSAYLAKQKSAATKAGADDL